MPGAQLSRFESRVSESMEIFGYVPKKTYFYLTRSSLGGVLMLIPQKKDTMLLFTAKKKSYKIILKKLKFSAPKNFEHAECSVTIRFPMEMLEDIQTFHQNYEQNRKTSIFGNRNFQLFQNNFV